MFLSRTNLTWQMSSINKSMIVDIKKLTIKIDDYLGIYIKQYLDDRQKYRLTLITIKLRDGLIEGIDTYNQGAGYGRD